MSEQFGSDMIYSDIVRVLRRYGGKRRGLVALTTIARSIRYPAADTLFYLQRMEERGIVEIVTDGAYAVRVREAGEKGESA